MERSTASASFSSGGIMIPTVTPQSHSPRRRLLTVKHVQDLTPHYRRITLEGDLEGFSSPGADDHVKLFFPESGVPFDAEALLRGENVSAGRDYTPRRHDPQAGELDLDFVMHGEGIGSTWAQNAQPGSPLMLGGPRGSLLVEGFASYLLAGDETALPSIARRLEELPAGVTVRVFIEVDRPSDELPLPTRAQAVVSWLHRHGAAPGSSDLLERALQDVPLSTDTFVWGGSEQATALRLREQFKQIGLNPAWIRVTGYWKRTDKDED